MPAFEKNLGDIYAPVSCDCDSHTGRVPSSVQNIFPVRRWPHPSTHGEIWKAVYRVAEKQIFSNSLPAFNLCAFPLVRQSSGLRCQNVQKAFTGHFSGIRPRNFRNILIPINLAEPRPAPFTVYQIVNFDLVIRRVFESRTGYFKAVKFSSGSVWVQEGKRQH